MWGESRMEEGDNLRELCAEVVVIGNDDVHAMFFGIGALLDGSDSRIDGDEEADPSFLQGVNGSPTKSISIVHAVWQEHLGGGAPAPEEADEFSYPCDAIAIVVTEDADRFAVVH
jgi:hypothetical protein